MVEQKDKIKESFINLIFTIFIMAFIFGIMLIGLMWSESYYVGFGFGVLATFLSYNIEVRFDRWRGYK